MPGEVPPGLISGQSREHQRLVGAKALERGDIFAIANTSTALGYVGMVLRRTESWLFVSLSFR